MLKLRVFGMSFIAFSLLFIFGFRDSNTEKLEYFGNLETLDGNPSNPYNSRGKMHNDGMEFLAMRLARNTWTSYTKTEHTTSIDVLNDEFYKDKTGGAYPESTVQEIVDFSWDDIVKNSPLSTLTGWKNKGAISNTAYNYLFDIHKEIDKQNSSSSTTDLNTTKTNLINIENTIIADKSISSTEKEVILTASAVGRYSLDYWHCQYTRSGSCNTSTGIFARRGNHDDHNWYFFKNFAGTDVQGVIAGGLLGVAGGPAGIAGGAFLGGVGNSWGWAIRHWIGLS